jgi:hypothetical protein
MAALRFFFEVQSRDALLVTRMGDHEVLVGAVDELGAGTN